MTNAKLVAAVAAEAARRDKDVTALLAVVGKIHNYYADIEDVLDSALTAEDKVTRIGRINAKLGKLVARTLPG